MSGQGHMTTNSDAHDHRTTQVRTDTNSIGGGAQHNNFGAGDQNNNTGSGSQYNANSMSFVNKENDNFLTDLYVTDPRIDKTRIERTKGNLLKGSYRWILEHDDFCRWRTEKQLLWIKGGPGKGKTMLLCGMIDELQAMGYESTFFFFCQATDARLNTATSVLRGLLYLILVKNTALLDRLRGEYVHAGAGKQLFEDVNSWDVLCKMLGSVIKHESLQGTVLVIDALDECTSGLDQLISFIIDLPPHIKVIVSSRLWMSIDRGLAVALEDTKIYLSLELNEDVISAAVDNYIQHKVEDLAKSKRYDEEMKSSVQTYLTENADNTFLWVALVYEQLADNRIGKRHTQQKLRAFPSGLDSLYHRILTQILDSPDAEDCKDILAVMTTVFRPLHMEELAALLNHVKFVGEIVEECGSLLTIREGVIYFTHQSAKDFLFRQSNRLMPLGMAHSHSLVLSRLLQIMSATLRRDIRQHGTPPEEINAPISDPLRPVQYACVYWAEHLTKGNIGQKQFDEVYSFIIEHFLHWLESLSILKSMSEGILSMFRVQRIVEDSTEPEEGKLVVREALRFIRYFRFPIEVDPMQVYLSALVFSPMNSAIRALNQHEEPKWPVMPFVAKNWSPCVQTLEGHNDEVTSVVFSGDDSTLASACQDGTVNIWDTATGHCSQTLKTSGEGLSLALSTNGLTVATTSGKYIELRNTLTGRREQKLRATGKPLSVAFSSDGLTLVSGLDDGSVWLWDMKSYRRQKMFGRHYAAVVSVDMSGDGSLIASASSDETVKIWRTSTRYCIGTIRHLLPVRSVAISHDGTRVASATREAASVFDLTGPVTAETLKHDRFFSVRAVAISRDGSQVSFGQEQGVVQLLDTNHRRNDASVSHISLSGHKGAVTSVAFSKNGSLLASASEDATIKLWDSTASRPGWSSQPSDPSVSNWDRQLSDSGNRHSLQRIVAWQRETQEAGREAAPGMTVSDIANRHPDPVHSLFLPMLKRYVISVSNKKTILWRAKTGEVKWAINSGCSKGCSATMFEDQVLVAEASGNHITIVNKTRNNALLRTLEVRYGSDSGSRAIISHEGSEHVPQPWRRKFISNGSGEVFHVAGLDDPGLRVDYVGFSASPNQYQLSTNFGTIDLSTTITSGVLPLTPNTHKKSVPSVNGGRYLAKGGGWIMGSGRRFLWLPTEYRPDVIESNGLVLAMGYNSGRVLIIPFHW